MVQGLLGPVVGWVVLAVVVVAAAQSSGCARPRGAARAWWFRPAGLTAIKIALVAVVGAAVVADLHHQPRQPPL